jgi:hypothetical protein
MRKPIECHFYRADVSLNEGGRVRLQPSIKLRKEIGAFIPKRTTQVPIQALLWLEWVKAWG